MNKSHALNTFWNKFGWLAFDENSVPDDTKFPYITYHEAVDKFGNSINLNASLWDRGNSWERISLKAEDISKYINEGGYRTIKLDNGYLWLNTGSPFGQRMGDPNDDKIKRIFLNISAEYLTNY